MRAGTILGRILDPFTECLTPEAAQRIVDFCVDENTQSRVNELAAMAGSGKIEESEREEYRELIEAFDMVAILKSRARETLARSH